MRRWDFNMKLLKLYSYLERHENAVINILMTFCRDIIKFYIRKLLINT